MVSVLKKPTSNSRGVLIFTHKERQFFSSGLDIVESKIKSLKKEYVVGMHWGIYQPDPVDKIPYVDFHLARESTVSFNSETTRIPLVAYNFNPKYMEPLDVPKRWDILTVAHPSKRKRLSDLLETIKIMFDEGYSPNVLLWCPSPAERGGPNWDQRFFELYENIFTNDERDQIELTTPIRDGSLYPLPHEIMPYLYNSSKIFTLFSNLEGDPRAITEALMCGTPVVVRSDLVGSGKDYLNAENSEIVTTKREAAQTFQEMLQNPDKYQVNADQLGKQLSIEHTAEKLEQGIKSVFQEKRYNYEGEIIKNNLSMKLPSHEITLPQRLRQKQSNDIKDIVSFVQFCDYICAGQNINTFRLRYYYDCLPYYIENKDRIAKHQVLKLLRYAGKRTGLPIESAARQLQSLGEK